MFSDWFDTDTKTLVGAVSIVGILVLGGLKGCQTDDRKNIQLSGHRAAVMTECLHTGHAVLECKDLLR